MVAPKGEGTRPTADRVRESLFNILMRNVRGARVLDLFAGSGALALEALSRGAQNAVLVEIDRAARAAIAENMRIVGASDRALLIGADWQAALVQLHEPFDLVFMDPPYAMVDVYGRAAAELSQRGLLAPGAVLVMEHRASEDLALPEGFSLYDQRRYGEAKLAFVREEERS